MEEITQYIVFDKWNMCYADEPDMCAGSSEGTWVRFEDHQSIVEKLQKELFMLKQTGNS